MIENKQRASLRVSLIPLVILVGLILGAGYFLLQGEISMPKFNKGPTIQRMVGFPTIIYIDEKMEKERRVITSEQELDEFLNLIDKSEILEVRESINFDKNIVLAVSSSTNETTGYEIKISKVYEDKEDQKIRVLFEEMKPGDTCTEEEMDINITVDMVILSKTDWEIDFERVLKTVECD